jgi:purine-nucleoside phosphorylase
LTGVGLIQENLGETVAYIRTLSKLKPRMGIVLGSGLGAFVDQMEIEKSIPYDEIPSFVPPTVDGHQGRLILGHVKGVPIAALQGRVHYYEGNSMATVVYPTRTLAMLGIEVLILTNSAGGLDPNMKPGDFMIIDDHINLMGDNPLKGPNLSQLGPRFPDMSEAYDKKLNDKMAEVLRKQGVSFWRGVYCGVSGPTYETPAEVRYLHMIGGKAVGMSTVPEAIAGNHLGLRVGALSCITNLASGLSQRKLSHAEVTATAKAVEDKFCGFLKEFIGTL